jgi:hypothetical protein
MAHIQENKPGPTNPGNHKTSSTSSRSTPTAETDIEKVASTNDLPPDKPRTHSLKITRSHHSRSAGDGYTCHAEEPALPNNTNVSPYLVSWDGGDADPLNPRSMSKLRRWIIVLICSASSLCV